MKLFVVGLSALAALGAAMSARSQGNESPPSLVFVSDDYCRDDRGCDAVSVLDGTRGELVYTGEHLFCSPGRLASDANQSLIVSQPANNTNALQLVTRWEDGSGAMRFTERLVTASRSDLAFIVRGAVAVSETGDWIIASMQEGVFNGSFPEGPYWLHRYAAPGADDEELGLPVSTREVDGAPIAMRYSGSRTVLYVVTDVGTIYQLHAERLEDVEAPFHTVRLTDEPVSLGRIHASIDAGDRIVVASQWMMSDALVIADLEARSFRVERISPGEAVWGLALNQASENHGVLAVHRGEMIEFYTALTDPMTFIGAVRSSVPVLAGLGRRDLAGSMAWNRAGTRLVVSSAPTGGFETFAVDVAAGPPVAVPLHAVDPCSREGGHGYSGVPSDVIAGNEWAVTATPEPTATLTGTAIPSATLTQVATETATHTPTEIARPPEPVYLPLALREERCQLARRGAIALVVDTSSSMTEPSPTGGTKLARAVEAAIAFVDLMTFPQEQGAIVGFDHDVQLFPLTAEPSDLRNALNALSSEPGTNIAAGVASAHEELTSDRRAPENFPVMIVLTDGWANEGPQPGVDAARLAKQDGIVIFTVGLGTEIDRQQLVTMATYPEWYYEATTADDLEAIYRAIAVDLPCPSDTYWGRR